MSKILIWKQITTLRSISFCNSCCFRYVKDTNMKANHNIARNLSSGAIGVFDISKIQIQKQITTLTSIHLNSIRCIWYFKDTNSKANHNSGAFVKFLQPVYLIFQRYKFKSKSQLLSVSKTLYLWCIWYFKEISCSEWEENQPTNKIMSLQFVIKFGKVRIIIEYKFWFFRGGKPPRRLDFSQK